MTDPAVRELGVRLRRHFRWAERAWRWMPPARRSAAAAFVGQTFSPDLADAPRIWFGLRTVAGCSDREAHALLARYYASQGLFATELHDYPGLDAEWARTRVACDNPEALAALRAGGGMALTYHSFHHNRLGAYLGLSGMKVYGIAATEDNSPFKPWTGRYIRALNGGSESCFGGGRYLFIDDLRATIKECRGAFARGDVVVTLADNISGAPGALPVEMMGRQLPMATGMIELAVEAGAPITLALFYSDLRGGHKCRLRRLPAGLSVREVADVYIQQLLAWTREDPHAWQGWAWWDAMPFTPGTEERGAAARTEASQRFPLDVAPAPFARRLLRLADRIETRLRPSLR